MIFISDEAFGKAKVSIDDGVLKIDTESAELRALIEAADQVTVGMFYMPDRLFFIAEELERMDIFDTIFYDAPDYDDAEVLY